MRNKVLVFILIVFLASPVFLQAKLNKVEMMVYRVKPGVALIETFLNFKIQYEDNGAKRVEQNGFRFSGTGFFVNPEGYLITNGHVVEVEHKYLTNKEKLYQEVLSYFVVAKLRQAGTVVSMENVQKWIKEHKPQLISLQIFPKVTLTNFEEYNYEIKKFSPPMTSGGKDIAVLKIERSNCPVLMLGDSSKVKLQQIVFPIGYPGLVDPYTFWVISKKSRLQPTISRGTITSLKYDYRNMNVFQTDAAITHGNSGGPAVDEDGNVIGLATFGATDPIKGQIQGYNFLIPINTAKEFIRDAGIEYNIESDFTKVYNKLLDAVWNEKWFEAKNYVAVALSYMSNQPDLKKLQQLIYTKIEHMGALKRMWIRNKLLFILVLILIIAVIVILIIALKPESEKKVESAAENEVKVEDVKVEDEGKTVLEEEDDKTMLEQEVVGMADIYVNGQLKTKCEIMDTGTIIGRDPVQSNCVIEETMVSKAHVKIVPKDDGFEVQDLNSTNGTYYNGEKIERKVIKPGERIQLGKKGTVEIHIDKV